MTYEIKVDMKCRDSRLSTKKRGKKKKTFIKRKRKFVSQFWIKDSGVFSMKGQIIFI